MNQKVFILPKTNKIRLHTLSPRYDSLEECRVSYSLFLGGFYG